jgi:hypothetical protein
MKLFRAKPVTVEAMKYDGHNAEEILAWSGGSFADFYFIEPGEWLFKDGDEVRIASDAWMLAHYEPLVA